MSIFDTTGSFEDLSQPITPIMQDQAISESSSYQGFFDTIMRRAAELDDKVTSLDAMRAEYDGIRDAIANAPALLTQWEREYAKISTTQTIVNAARDAVNTGRDWWNRLQEVLGNPTGMSLVFAIPWGIVGTISAATAAIAAVIYSSGYALRQFKQYRLQQINEERATQNLPPLVDPSLNETSIFGDIGGIVKWIVIGGGLYLLLQRM